MNSIRVSNSLDPDQDGHSVSHDLGSNKLYICLYSGTVPYEPEIVALADGETVVRQTYPTIGLDVQCGKNTDFNYGPWADRQR